MIVLILHRDYPPRGPLMFSDGLQAKITRQRVFKLLILHGSPKHQRGTQQIPVYIRHSAVLGNLKFDRFETLCGGLPRAPCRT